MVETEITCSEIACIRWSPHTGESWLLAIPTDAKSAAWEPVEVRP